MNVIEFGDCRDTMRRWASEGVKAQMCVTSPPYFGLRSYLPDDSPDKPLEIGLEETPDQYIQRMVEVFRCVRDVLADDGTLWLNIGDSYNAYNGNRGRSTLFQKATDEALPKLPKGAGLTVPDLKNKDLIGIPWMLAFALRADGWYLRQDIIWHKSNPMPESVTDRCTKAHEYIFLLSKSSQYHYDHAAIAEPAVTPIDGRGSTEERKMLGHPSRYGDTESMAARGNDFTMPSISARPFGRNRRSVWSVNVKPYHGAHFATFPEELIEPCIMAGSRVGDIVLDPFMGSGTTAQVAQDLGRQYIGCELNPAYKALQDKRTKQQALLLA
jgi:DNA modification methylase